jgi:hypothetical protein
MEQFLIEICIKKGRGFFASAFANANDNYLRVPSS